MSKDCLEREKYQQLKDLHDQRTREPEYHTHPIVRRKRGRQLKEVDTSALSDVGADIGTNEQSTDHPHPVVHRKRRRQPKEVDTTMPSDAGIDISMNEQSTDESTAWRSDNNRNLDSDVESDIEDVAWSLSRMTTQDVLDQAERVSPHLCYSWLWFQHILGRPKFLSRRLCQR